MTSIRNGIDRLLLEHPENLLVLRGVRPGDFLLRRRLKRPKRFLARIPLIKMLIRYL